MTVMPIGAVVRGQAERNPDRPSITEVDVASGTERTITRIELERRTNRLARHLEQLGVGQDDLVTIGLPNGIAFYEVAIATWKVGATPQPVSPRLPARERAEIVALARPALVVTEPIDPDPSLPDGPLPQDRVAAAYKAPTSGGSTGRPKIIVSGLRGEVDLDAPPTFNMEPDGVQLVPGPLYHNAPFMFSMRGLFSGSHLVVMSRFDPAIALELVERYSVTWILMVPTMMQRIWRLPVDERLKRDVSSVAGILHLAAPCPPWLKEAWIEWLGADKIFELYAGTEAQGVTVITGEEWLAHKGSVGKPTEGTMRILDGDGTELPPGEVGEIWMRPPERPTYRYIGAEPRCRDDGWESLGDMGWMDGDGYLYIADRRTDLILAGGANIYPAEVEAALEEHSAVLSCAVIGLPDDDLGQRVHAVVQLQHEVGDDELRRFLAERLVTYKIPRSFERVVEPVRDDAGKVRRTGLVGERTPA